MTTEERLAAVDTIFDLTRKLFQHGQENVAPLKIALANANKVLEERWAENQALKAEIENLVLEVSRLTEENAHQSFLIGQLNEKGQDLLAANARIEELEERLEGESVRAERERANWLQETREEAVDELRDIIRNTIYDLRGNIESALSELDDVESRVQDTLDKLDEDYCQN